MEHQAKRAAARETWRGIVSWFNALELSENAILIAFSLAIGVLSALGVAAFYKSIDFAFSLFYRIPGELVPGLAAYAYRPVLTAAGIATAWWFMRYIGRGHDGMNVPDVQLAVVRRGGIIPTRPALARTAASAITIGAGGSAGSNLSSLVLAIDLAHPSETILPNETLLDATRRMGARGVRALPVLDAVTGRVLGLLSRHNVLAAYERAIAGSSADEETASAESGRNVA